MKRWICLLAVAVLAVSVLAGCGKGDTDYYMKGYDAMEAGRYRDALDYFKKAEKKGDDHAEEAIRILNGYLNAEEAWNVGDADGAKAFLEKIPQNYKYYPMAEAVDRLRREVYGGQLDEEQGDQTDAEKDKNGEFDIGNQEKDAFVKQEEIDLILHEVEILIEAGRLDMAEEQLYGLNRDDMSQRQKQRDKEYRDRIAEKKETQKAKGRGQEDFTPEKALEYLQRVHNIQGDLGAALAPKYADDGTKYYEVTMQLGEGDNAEIVTMQIFGDGTVRRKGE